MRPLLFALLAALPCIGVPPALARSGPASEIESNTPTGFSLGVGVISAEGVRVGEDARTFVIPTVGYEGPRFFFRGISGGAHLVSADGFELDLILAARLDGWDARDLDRAGLARVGIDRDLLEDRDSGIDAGFAVSLEGAAGKLGLELRSDISGASRGQEGILSYRLPIPFGQGLLVPALSLNYASARLTRYYYGTLDAEEAASVMAYRPGSALIPGAGVAYLRTLSPRWSLAAAVEVRRLPNAIARSPLVDPGSRTVPTLFVGVSRSFGKR